MLIGAAVITKLMTAYAHAPANTAMRNCGVANGVCGALLEAWTMGSGETVGVGTCRRESTAIVAAYRMLTATNEPAYSVPGISQRAANASCGLTIAAPRLPIKTYETAWLRRSGGALSAAANRYC